MTAATLKPIEMSNNGQDAAEAESVAGKTLAEFSARQAAILAMRERFTGLTCATPKDYESTRLAIAELRTFRREVKERKGLLNEKAYAWIKSINAESARLIEEAEAIESLLQAMKDAVDAEKARKKAELEAAQKKRLEDAARQKVEEEAAKVKAEQDARAEANRAENERLAGERAKINAENARLAAEREKIEAERQAAAWKLELARQEEEKKQAAARAELERQQRELQAKVDAAEKAERDRQATIVAEQQRKDRVEREAKEAADAAAELARVTAEKAAKEAARAEAMKPDIERVRDFGAKVLGLVPAIPEVGSEDARLLTMATREMLERIGKKLTAFGV